MAARLMRASDVDALVALQGGVDRRSAVALSVQSAASDARELVLVAGGADGSAAPLIGAIGLATSADGMPPHACYRLGTVVHASADLHIFNRARTLLLGNDLSGCARLRPPLMAAGAVDGDQAALVSDALAFMRAHPGRFGERVFIELRGRTSAEGVSPFWQALGRHFYAAAVPEDDGLRDVPQRLHLARLMPKHPLYCSFLPDEVQACIGEVHETQAPLMAMLRSFGFRFQGHVSMIDAGPILEVAFADLDA